MVNKGLALPINKNKPVEEEIGPTLITLPHVRKVINEAPPEYIVMIAVAFLHVFAITISLGHVLHKHRSFSKIRPRMVFPTLAMLSFYWTVASLNLIGLVIIRANLLCQTLCSCCDAVTTYMLCVLCISYADGKVSYFTITKWTDLYPASVSCSSLCCCLRISREKASRAMAYIIQYIFIMVMTSLSEVICENEELFHYPVPLTRSYVLFGIKAVQVISFCIALCGSLILCRAASLVSPKTSPYIKLILFKCVFILSSLQNHGLIYMAFNRLIPKLGANIDPVIRAVVWGNFATVIECAVAYFIATRVYRIKDYNKVGNKDKSKEAGEDLKILPGHRPGDLDPDTPTLSDQALDNKDLRNLKFEELGVKMINASPDSDKCTSSSSNLRALVYDSEEEVYKNSKKGKLKKGAFNSVDAVVPDRKKQSKVQRPKSSGGLSGTYTQLTEEDEDLCQFEPRISISQGKVNISLNPKDFAKLCQNNSAIPISLDDVSEHQSSTDSHFESKTLPNVQTEKTRFKYDDKLDESSSSECDEVAELGFVEGERTNDASYVSKTSLV